MGPNDPFFSFGSWRKFLAYNASVGDAGADLIIRGSLVAGGGIFQSSTEPDFACGYNSETCLSTARGNGDENIFLTFKAGTDMAGAGALGVTLALTVRAGTT